MSDCYYDDAGCLVCPEQDASPAVPGYVKTVPVIGWNAGANSIAYRDGDLHAVFTMSHSTGVMIGLKGSRTLQTAASLIEHGWYLQSVAGTSVAQVIESGVTKTAKVVYVADTTSFEIRRLGAAVLYLRDSVLVYTSTVPSIGAKIVNACLYSSGDTTP